MSSEPTVPATARAAVLTEFKKSYEVKEDYPVKQPRDLAPGQCLIKLEYTGVCHSDLHIKNNDWARSAIMPLVGGHEGVGHVVAIAPGNDAPVKIGDRVGVKWLGKICSHCEMCRVGADACCPVAMTHSHGFQIHGTFAQYVVSYTGYVTPIPEGLDSASATPLLCAGLTIYKALKSANAKVGQWVAIGGAGGGLGHLGIQYAVAMGYRVIAIDAGEDKKQLCLKLGAEKWVDFKESKDLIKDVQAATADGKGPQAAIIAAGDPRPFNQALMYLRHTGTLVCVGMPGATAMINAPIALLVAKSLAVVGSAVGNRQDTIEALQIAASGKVKCQLEVRDLKDLNGALDEMEAGKVVGRVVLKL